MHRIYWGSWKVLNILWFPFSIKCSIVPQSLNILVWYEELTHRFHVIIVSQIHFHPATSKVIMHWDLLAPMFVPKEINLTFYNYVWMKTLIYFSSKKDFFKTKNIILSYICLWISYIWIGQIFKGIINAVLSKYFETQQNLSMNYTLKIIVSATFNWSLF